MFVTLIIISHRTPKNQLFYTVLYHLRIIRTELGPVIALLEERKNSFDESNKKIKIANVDLEGLSNLELQQLLVKISKLLQGRTK